MEGRMISVFYRQAVRLYTKIRENKRALALP